MKKMAEADCDFLNRGKDSIRTTVISLAFCQSRLISFILSGISQWHPRGLLEPSLVDLRTEERAAVGVERDNTIAPCQDAARDAALRRRVRSLLLAGAFAANRRLGGPLHERVREEERVSPVRRGRTLGSACCAVAVSRRNMMMSQHRCTVAATAATRLR